MFWLKLTFTSYLPDKKYALVLKWSVSLTMYVLDGKQEGLSVVWCYSCGFKVCLEKDVAW